MGWLALGIFLFVVLVVSMKDNRQDVIVNQFGKRVESNGAKIVMAHPRIVKQ